MNNYLLSCAYVRELVHGEQPLYTLGQLAPIALTGDASRGRTHTFELPDLHALVEHCSSCTLHSGGFQVRLYELVELEHAGVERAVVHTRAFNMQWHL